MNTDKNKTRIEMLFAGVNFDTYFGTVKTEYNDDFSPKSVTLVYDEQQDKNWKNLISTCLQDNVKVDSFSIQRKIWNVFRRSS